MDLLDVAQVPCLRCETPINHLIMPEQDQGDIICERCLELESKRFIYLNLEMQIIERSIKELKGGQLEIEGRYKGCIADIEKREEEEVNATMDVGVGSMEVSHF